MKHRFPFFGSWRVVVSLAIVGILATALAENFFGFDPTKFSGKQLKSSAFKSMIAAATKNRPPRNGKKYVIGFANIIRTVNFTQLVEKGIQRNADAAGVDLVIGDNQGSGATACGIEWGTGCSCSYSRHAASTMAAWIALTSASLSISAKDPIPLDARAPRNTISANSA